MEKKTKANTKERKSHTVEIKTTCVFCFNNAKEDYLVNTGYPRVETSIPRYLFTMFNCSIVVVEHY